MQTGGLALRCTVPDFACPASPRAAEPSTPRTPRSPLLVTCGSSGGSSAGARISRRRWGAPPPHAALAAEPAPPPSPRPAAAPQQPQSPGCCPPQQQEEPPPGGEPVYDCVDVATQSLAVNLTLEEYRQSLLGGPGPAAAAAAAAPEPGGGAPGGVPPTALPALTHLSLSSADLEAMGLCTHCRYPCYLSGMPACEASHYLQMWDGDAALKPRGFDAHASLRLRGLADIAAVSAGGRANGRWKPDNQDAFLVAPTAAAAAAAPGAADGPGEPPAAAAIGVFDGHGRLGASAAAIVRRAMAARLAELRPEQAAAAAAAGLRGAADLLDGCFAAAEEAMEGSGRDFSKSGCTAVLALLDADNVSVAWAGDSRAVLGVCDASPSLLGSVLGSADGGGSPPGSPGAAAAAPAAAAGSGSWDAPFGPLCAAVPLTEDHKPNRPAERERIAAAGGRVARLATDREGNPAGPFRVFVPNCWSPGLALSRAFGDTLASSVGVTAKPEVTVLPLPPAGSAPSSAPGAAAGVSNSPSASFCAADGGAPSPAPDARHVLIVASDGLWEWVSNATAVGIASSAASAEDAAHALVEAAQKQWAVRYRGRNCDDITVVVAFLER